MKSLVGTWSLSDLLNFGRPTSMRRHCRNVFFGSDAVTGAMAGNEAAEVVQTQLQADDIRCRVK